MAARRTLVVAGLACSLGLSLGAPAWAATAGPRPHITPSAPHSIVTSVPGAQQWLKRYNGPGDGADTAAAEAVSADSTRVFVTGQSYGGPATGMNYATVAYSAATGTRLWASRYNGPASGADGATSVAVSPDDTRVFVTGGSVGAPAEDFATVAYDAATGARLWVSRYGSALNQYPNAATSVAVSPDGTRVFVTGQAAGGNAAATVAYDAATGAQLWVAVYTVSGGDAVMDAVGVSPDGTKLFVTGWSGSASIGVSYATLAYSTASGAQLWASLYHGPGPLDEFNAANSLAVSPEGTALFVTGNDARSDGLPCYATLAYSASTGGRLWVRRYHNGSSDVAAARSDAISPDGAKLFVTGSSNGTSTGPDYATLAYDTSTGSQLWLSRYNGPGNSADVAQAVAVSPDDTRVFVTGQSYGTTTSYDYATIAYHP